MRKLYALSKKYHNLVMWVVIVLGGGMTISGILMNRYIEGEWIPVSASSMVVVRQMHRVVSNWFVLVLGIQVLTGLVLWWVPKLWKKKVGEKGDVK